MPKGLSREAAREWRSIVPQLRAMGVLSSVDAKALAGYCHSFARWFEAEKLVKKYGVVVREPVLLMGTPTGYFRLKKNPAVTVSEAAQKTMRAFLCEFGMTPSSRSRVRVEKQIEEADPFEQFLKGATPAPDPKRVN